LRHKIRKFEEDRQVSDYLNWLMTAVLPQLITPMVFVISIMSGNILTFGDSIELLALIGRARGPIERVVDIQRSMVNIKISLLKVNEYMNQPEIRKASKAEPDHPNHAIYIDNKNFSWGVKTMDLNEQYEKMAKAMRWKFNLGRIEKPKTKEQLEDEERRERERRQQRELKKVVILKDITLKVPKGKFVCIIGKTGSGKSSLL
jgi:ABC-type multidrug transport system fused ATPase/permease subunit